MAKKTDTYLLSEAQRAIVAERGGITHGKINDDLVPEEFVPGKIILGLALGPLHGGKWRELESIGPWGLVAANGTVQVFYVGLPDNHHLADLLKRVPVGAVLRIACVREDADGDLHFRVRWKPRGSRRSRS